MKFFISTVSSIAASFSIAYAAAAPVYPAPNDYGLTAQQVIGAKKYPQIKLPPAKIATLIREPRFPGKVTVQKHAVTADLLEEAGVSRNAEIRFGMPLPEKAVYDNSNFAVFNAAGKQIPALIAILSFYPDGSLRQVLITADIPLKAHEKSFCKVEFGGTAKNIAPETKLQISRKGDVWHINTGAATFTVDSGKFNLAEIFRNGKKVNAFAPGKAIELTDDKGHVFTTSAVKPDSVKWVEKGDMRATLRIAGYYGDAAGKAGKLRYVARLSFKAGNSDLRVEFTHTDTSIEREFDDLRSINVNFASNGGNVVSALLTDGKMIAGKKRIFQETDQMLTTDASPRMKARATGDLRIGNSALALERMWQRFPKAVSVKADGSFALELLPAQPDKNFNRDLPHHLAFPFSNGLYRFKWGMAFTERFIFSAGNALLSSVVAAECNKPVIAVLPSDYYVKCKRIAQDYKLFHAIDKDLIDAFYAHLKRREEVREFGFFNYGDNYGERGHNWTNNEYDPADSLAALFMRSGNRDVFRFVEELARHQANSDTCHAYPLDYFIGSNLQHAVGHSGVDSKWSSAYTRYTAASGGHTWTRGRIHSYEFSGDLVVMDSAYLTGDHIAFAAVPNYPSIRFTPGYAPNWPGLAPREIGWMLRALTGLWECTTDETYKKAADTIADIAIKECAYEKGAWPRRTYRMSKHYKIHKEGNTTYQPALLIRGLVDYERVFKNGRAVRAIHSASRWILKGFHPEDGASFNYDLAWDGEQLNWPYSNTNCLIAPTLMDAADLTGDKELFTAGQLAMASSLAHPFNIRHKEFAMGMAFLGDFINASGSYYRKHPDAQKTQWNRDDLIAYVLDQPYRTWRRRGGGDFHIELQKKKCKIKLQRWIRSGKNNKKPAELFGFEIFDENGKKLEHVFDEKGKKRPVPMFRPVRLSNRLSFYLHGKGKKYTIRIKDTMNNDWSILPLSGVKNYAPVKAGVPVDMAHNGLRKHYFVIPAGQSLTVTAYGVHAGMWEAAVYDHGKKVASREAYRDTVLLKGMPSDDEVLRYTFKAENSERLGEIISSANADFRLIFDKDTKIASMEKYLR